jgi:L-fucose mutarotase/ribose pyranase (RbsD/FucU family)
MLKGIPTVISPDLMGVLMSMGHGDEIVIADGNFPSASVARRLLRARNAYSVVSTGDKAIYANIILKKGLVKPRIGFGAT